MALHAKWTTAMARGWAIVDGVNVYRVVTDIYDDDRAVAAVTTAQGFGGGPGTPPDVLAPYKPGNKIVIQVRDGARVSPS
ncbi:hypothetical protein GCM10017673_39370 [Streptosporangium violaceochromogenes]|nr:hypothetical protein GCM10017673_39370 [Streptosporangium violaceochromogenes]